MAAESCCRLVTFLSLIYLSICSTVPVISWWYGKSNISPVLAGHSLSESTFQSHFEPILENNDMLLVFLQDELSIDDFTRYGQAFPFVKSSLKQNNHVVFPSVVQSDSSIVELFKGAKKSKIIRVPMETDWDSFDIESKIENNVVNILLVPLEPLSDSTLENKDVILKSNDKMMKSITTRALKTGKSVAAVYTSDAQSKDIIAILSNEELENEHSLNSRHLLADAQKVNPKKMLTSNCVNMFLTGLLFGPDNTNLTDLIDVVNNKTDKEGICLPGRNYSIVVKTEGKKGPYEDFKMTMELEQNNSTMEWMCKLITVNYKAKNGSNLNEKFECGMQMVWLANSYNTIASPLQYSFACNSMKFEGEKKSQLQFNGFQLQANIHNGNDTIKPFADAYNCEGFFSLPILTGLLVGALLIASLFLGTMMMMNIQTQDRFDDAKGKTISVAAQE